MIGQMRVQELAELLEAGKPVQLLDVREQWEHDLAALPNSQLIPLNQLEARAAEVVVPEGTTLVVYCHHGIRSQSAAWFLLERGLTNVASLVGGIDAWSQRVDPRVPRY